MMIRCAADAEGARRAERVLSAPDEFRFSSFNFGPISAKRVFGQAWRAFPIEDPPPGNLNRKIIRHPTGRETRKHLPRPIRVGMDMNDGTQAQTGDRT